MYFITDFIVFTFLLSSVSLCIGWFKELCSNAVKKKHLMKLNCGTKVPLFAFTFFLYKSWQPLLSGDGENSKVQIKMKRGRKSIVLLYRATTFTHCT